jgi:hypothetical protein
MTRWHPRFSSFDLEKFTFGAGFVDLDREPIRERTTLDMSGRRSIPPFPNR